MDNQDPTPAPPCPWYDDRVEAVRKDDPAPRMEAAEGPARYTPREIYAYLDCKVWKQTEAKRADAGSRIGFGSAQGAVRPYARPLGEADLIHFGVMPEFMGRIQRIVSLEPMAEEDYHRMTDSSLGFLAHIGEQYGADIRLAPRKRRELAELAYRTGLGVRGMENQLRRLVDDAIFDDCERRCFEF